MAQRPNVYDQAAVIHRNKGFLIIGIAVLVIASLITIIRLMNWPYLPVLVDGALQTKQVPVHFSAPFGQ